MRWVRLGLLGLLFVLLTLRDPGGLAAAGVAPQWFLLLALLAGIAAAPGWAALLAWVAGLLVDLLSLEPLGLHAFSFGVAAVVLARVRRSFFAEHPLTQGGLGFAAALLVTFALLVRLEAAEPAFRFAARLPGAFLTALVTAVALPALAALDRWMGLLDGFRERGEHV